MIIREAKYHDCEKCGSRRQTQTEAYGCDSCRKPLNLHGLTEAQHHNHLQATVFRHRSSTESTRLHFCSWRCCLKGLRSVKTDYFISMPYLLFDESTPGLKASDFWKLVR